MVLRRTLTLSVLMLASQVGACGNDKSSTETPDGTPGADVFAFANGCVSIGVEEGARFIAPAASGSSFEASATELETASRFRMRAADLGTYLLFDEDEQYLVSDGSRLQRVPVLESDTNKVGDVIEIDDESIVDINALSGSRPWRHNIQYREIRRSA